MYWVSVPEDEYWDMLGCLPPEARSAVGFLVGEISRHSAEGVPLFQAYIWTDEGFFKSFHPMSVEEFRRLK